jgi:hypothetical protein
MSQNAFSMLAVIAALTFLTMALTACASSEHVTTAAEPVQLAAVELPPGVPEFHGAHIGDDSLRGELPSEN